MNPTNSHKSSLLIFAAALSASAMMSATALAQSGTWINTSSDGNWSDTTNWASGIVADGAGNTANFVADFTVSPVVNLDTARTIGSIVFSDTGGTIISSLTISNAANLLTLDNGSIAPDLVVNSSSSLVLDANINAGANGLAIEGASGNNTSHVVISQPASYAGDTMLYQGIFSMGADNVLPSTTVVKSMDGRNTRFDLNGHVATVGGIVSTNTSYWSGYRQIIDQGNNGAGGGTLILDVAAGQTYEYQNTIGVGSWLNIESDNFGVTKTGPGTQIFNRVGGNNGYLGATVIDDGILEVKGNNNLGTAAAGTYITNTGTLGLAVNDTSGEFLTISGSGYNGMGAIAAMENPAGFSGSIYLVGNATIGADFPLTLSGYNYDDGSGYGITKIGTNELSLSGVESYTGPTIIADGWLTVPETSGLGLSGSLTLTNTLNLNFGDVAGNNPTTAKIYDATYANGGVPLTVNGTVTVNIIATNLTAGAVPLIDYSGTIGGSGFAGLQLGSVPLGLVGASLSNDVANTIIYLNIPGVASDQTWLGGVSSDWDINTTANWSTNVYAFPLISNVYQEFNTSQGLVGDNVTFDDNFMTYGNPSATNINVTTVVSPISITFNSSYPFSLGGAGKISGASTLSMQGSGSLTINTANDYSGGSTLSSGLFLAGANDALGTGLVSLSGGMLGAANGSWTLPNHIDVQTGTTLVVTNGNLTFSGTVSQMNGSRFIITGGGAVALSGPMDSQGRGGLDIQGSSFVVDGGSATNGWDGIRLYAQGGESDLVITNNGQYVLGEVPGTPYIRLGQTADEAGTNYLRMDSGTLLMSSTACQLLVGDKNNTTGMVYQTGGTIKWQSDNSPTGVHFGTGTNTYGEYHLDGGVLETPSISVNPTCYGAFDWNGGTLRVSTNANSQQFMTGVDVNIQSGGAVLDSADYDVTIGSSLSGVGAFTKLGNGVVTLSGTDTYQGDTIINAGYLVLGANYHSPGNITVADGAGVSFLSSAPGQTVTVPSATVGTATGGHLAVKFQGQTGIPTAPAAYITNLTLVGNVAIDLQSFPGVSVGEIPLIGYTPPLLGGGSVVAGTIPQGVEGTITNDTANHIIALLVTNVVPLVWTGSSTNFYWDINTTTNWTLNGAPTIYRDAANVLFNDSAVINAAHMVGVLQPDSITVSNSAMPFSIQATSASDYLAGNMGLVKEGTNELLLGGANTFSGIVNVMEGTLFLWSGGTLGSAVGNTVIHSGATLDLNGQSVGSEEVVIAGSGVGGTNGAIMNTGGQNQSALSYLTLAGDATITANVQRWDIYNPGSGAMVKGNGYKLTKTGSQDIWFKDVGDTGFGDIDVVGGLLGFQGDPIGMGDSSKTMTLNNGTLGMWALGATDLLDKHLVLTNDSTIYSGGGSNNFVGPVMLYGTNTLVAGTALHLWGNISGPGGFEKQGGAALYLDGTNSYTGDTVISQGTLALGTTATLAATPTIQVGSNTILDVTAAAPWSLQSSQTLSGSGTVNGDVDAAGTISPGPSISALNFNGNLSLSGNVQVKLNKDQSVSNDAVNVTGTLTYGGMLTVTNIGVTPLIAGDTFQVFPAGGTGTITVVGDAGTGLKFSFNDGVLSVVSSAPPQLGWTALGNGVVQFSFASGYKLIWQTNSLAVGLSTNWVDYPDTNNPVNVTNNPDVPCSFFGLRQAP